MFFEDRLVLDAPRRTRDGFYAVRARAARTGVYQYLASEPSIADALPPGHNFKPNDIVKVLRDESTVFDEASARSFIGKPVTDDHPKEAVTADNWRQHARGTVMGAMRDGDYLAFDLLLTDAEAIKKIDNGKRELSNGYAADIEFGQFTSPDGIVCDARQTKIYGNHVALVSAGRAGSECAIKDGEFAICDANPAALAAFSMENAVKKIVLDGLQVDLSDADAVAAAISKLQTDMAVVVTAKDAAETKLAEAQTSIAAKDAEIVTLKKAVEDAKVTPQQMRDAAKAYALVCDKAKALGVQFAEDASADTIMKAVVDAKMGDLAKDWSADQVAASFAVLAKDAKSDPLARDVKTATTTAFATDTASIRDAAKRFRNVA